MTSRKNFIFAIFFYMNNTILIRYVSKTLRLGGYKKDYRLTNFPSYLKSVLIGLLLSDGSLERSSNTSYPRLNIIMSLKNYSYILHLFNLFEPYVNSPIHIIDITKNNETDNLNIYRTARFKTVSLPQLVKYYNFFYKENIVLNKWIKVVPKELMQDFDYISLAHLIMGDGNYLKERGIIRIYTNSFSKSHVNLLSNTIYENLGIINKVVHDRKDQYVIHIEKRSLELTKDLVLQYMHPSMYYKLGLKSESDNNFNYLNIIDSI